MVLACLVACGADRPLVERFDDGQWLPDSFQVTSLGGRRSLATFPFVLRLAGPAGRGITGAQLSVDGGIATY